MLVKVSLEVESIYRRWKQSDMNCAKLAEGIANPYGFNGCILLTSDKHMSELNHYWRRNKKPTNVLSFQSLLVDSMDFNKKYLGDVALGFETVNKEAVIMKTKRANHVAHLVIHGILHLMGFSHKKIRQTIQMQREEIRLLNLIGVNNPYLSNKNG